MLYFMFVALAGLVIERFTNKTARHTVLFWVSVIVLFVGAMMWWYQLSAALLECD